MKSRRGSAAVIISVIVLVLVIVGVFVWLHYSSHSAVVVESTSSSTPALATATATTTAANGAVSTPAPATTASSTTSGAFLSALGTCAKGSGTILAETVLADNGDPTAYVDYNVSVKVLGTTGQNCSFTISDPTIVSFTETTLGKQQTTASAATIQAEMQASMAQTPTATCTIPESSVASVASSFSDPTKFDAFVNSSACGN